MPKKIFIGVAWPYVNGDIHIGHLAGYLLPADIFARFHRYIGNDVLMVSGSDCFGTPITLEADKRGVAPQEIVDEYHAKHKKLFKDLRISFDIFTRTTTENHKKVVQEFFLSFLEKGYVFKGKAEQYYDPKEKRFLPDRYVEGTCPYCGYKEAKSDQCDSCTKVLEQGELQNPRSKLTGEAVETHESEHYFFDLTKLQPFLKKYVKEKSGSWKKWVRRETEEWLKRGLKPRAFTRDMEWGVPLPVKQISKEQGIADIKRKSIYVWWEAVVGYFSASLEWAKKENKDWEIFWHNNEARHYYFMGKDNLVFHTLFWPGELHVHDEKLHLPDVLVINQFLTFETEKLSKSRGVVVDSKYIVEKYGLDPVRFYVCSIMPEYADTSFSWEDFAAKHNNILIGTFGNFINRTLTLAKGMTVQPEWLESEVVSETKRYLENARQALIGTEFKNYAETVVALADFGNKYLSRTQPWTLKDDKDALAKAIINALFVIAALLLISKPLLVETNEKLQKLLGIDFETWEEDAVSQIKKALPNIKITDPQPLFTKIDESVIEEERKNADIV